MSERIVLAYGDSNTHGTMPMARLEDTGRFGPAERWPGVGSVEFVLFGDAVADAFAAVF